VHSGFGDRDTEDFRTGWLKHVVWMKALVERGDSWVPPSNLAVAGDAELRCRAEPALSRTSVDPEGEREVY
jgi:hypothetical protein